VLTASGVPKRSPNPIRLKFIFPTGGESTWREYLTLPNILKEFNPSLIGYAIRDSLGSQKSSQFNVAEPMAITSDMPFQAELLVRRMRSDKRVDYENDWKVGEHSASYLALVSLKTFENGTKNHILSEYTCNHLDTMPQASLICMRIFANVSNFIRYFNHNGEF
jgi:hypothetical protein